MNRKFLVVGLIGLVVAVGWGGGPSEGQPGLVGGAPVAGTHSIAVLDLVRVYNECAQIKDLNEMIRTRTDEVTQEANQRKDIIENKSRELAAFEPGKADYETRRKDLLRLNVDANVWFKVQEEELEREKFEWTRIIYERSITAAGEIAREQGYDLVIQRVDFRPNDIEQTVQTLRRVLQDRTVIYNVPEIDITDIVIRRLDAQYNAGGGRKQLGLTPSATTLPATP